LVRLNESTQGCTRQKRDIAREKDDRALSARKPRFRLLERMRRSQLRFLNDKAQIRSIAYQCLYCVSSVTDDQGYGRWRNRLRDLEDVFNERFSGEPMQDLRHTRLHSGPLACGEHDDVYIGWHHLCYTTNILRSFDS
jgi:hypothetical protein